MFKKAISATHFQSVYKFFAVVKHLKKVNRCAGREKQNQGKKVAPFQGGEV
jgi:hypothetical protein